MLHNFPFDHYGMLEAKEEMGDQDSKDPVDSDRSSESGGGEPFDRELVRKHRNRQSAALSRQRKREQLEMLEQRCAHLEETVTRLQEENAQLKERLYYGSASSGEDSSPPSSLAVRGEEGDGAAAASTRRRRRTSERGASAARMPPCASATRSSSISWTASSREKGRRWVGGGGRKKATAPDRRLSLCGKKTGEDSGFPSLSLFLSLSRHPFSSRRAQPSRVGGLPAAARASGGAPRARAPPAAPRAGAGDAGPSARGRRRRRRARLRGSACGSTAARCAPRRPRGRANRATPRARRQGRFLCKKPTPARGVVAPQSPVLAPLLLLVVFVLHHLHPVVVAFGRGIDLRAGRMRTVMSDPSRCTKHGVQVVVREADRRPRLGVARQHALGHRAAARAARVVPRGVQGAAHVKAVAASRETKRREEGGAVLPQPFQAHRAQGLLVVDVRRRHRARALGRLSSLSSGEGKIFLTPPAATGPAVCVRAREDYQTFAVPRWHSSWPPTPHAPSRPSRSRAPPRRAPCPRRPPTGRASSGTPSTPSSASCWPPWPCRACAPRAWRDPRASLDATVHAWSTAAGTPASLARDVPARLPRALHSVSRADAVHHVCFALPLALPGALFVGRARQRAALLHLRPPGRPVLPHERDAALRTRAESTSLWTAVLSAGLRAPGTLACAVCMARVVLFDPTAPQPDAPWVAILAQLLLSPINAVWYAGQACARARRRRRKD